MTPARLPIRCAGAFAGAALLAAMVGAPAVAAPAAAAPMSATESAPISGVGPVLQGPQVAVPHSERATYDFNAGWRFALVNTNGTNDPTGAYAHAADPGFNDSGWRSISVPHDWSIELNPRAKPATTSGTGFYPGGLGWYRKTFVLPKTMAGRDLSVQFDGVYMDAHVYLNGRLLGVHHYGYTGFSMDLKGAHTDGRTPNVLAVSARNRVPSSRWYSGSGIYRNVRLVATDPLHIERLGVQVTTPRLESTVASGYGVAHVATTFTGGTRSGTPVTVSSIVRDAAGNAVGQASASATVGPSDATTAVNVRVAHPHLWDVNDPALYSVTTTLARGARVVDTYVTRMGFRYTRFDPQAGFFLNGRRMKLQGVDLHHDQGALGSAVDRDAIMRQLRIMKSMGVNALRTSHNPPAPELVAGCEELGIVMMVEAFDVWNVAKVPYDYARYFDADSDRDITEMVRESQNSPAVVMWSIGNEIPNSTEWSGVPIARRLIADVRRLDPTRPVVIGSDKYRSLPDAGSPAERILLMLDGVGLNYNTAESVDELHARYPHTFFFESESSSETSTRGEYDQPAQLNTGENHTPGHRSASSYDNNLESWTMSGEYSLKKDRDRQWFLGQFLWSGMDYIGEPTPFDVFPVKTSFFGAVDTAGFPKDQYFLFKSQWTTTPLVHLLPMDWTAHRPGSTVQVWAYANVANVELFLNGRSLGVRRFDRKVTAGGRHYLETTEATGDDKNNTTGPYAGSYVGDDGTAGHLHLTWNVPFRPGTLVAVAEQNGVEVARDVLRTAGPPAAIRLHSDRTRMSGGERSLAYVTADVVDAHGTLVPNADNALRFTVSGGRLVGVDNGREEDQESYKARHRTAFNGKALAIATATGSALTVTATAPGLRSDSVSVAVTPVVHDGAEARQDQAPPAWFTPDAPWQPVPRIAPGPSGLTADASFSGSDDTVPAFLVDGDPMTEWSNAYVMAATALLPEISAARPNDWVSVSWARPAGVGRLSASFVVDAQHRLPAAVSVNSWNGAGWQPVTGVHISRGGGSSPTLITFDAVRTTRLRLDMTSSAPEQPDGFLAIRELSVPQ